MGVENVAALRKNLGWETEESFTVPEDVYANFKSIAAANAGAEECWNVMFEKYQAEYPEMKTLWEQYHDKNSGRLLEQSEDFWAIPEKAEATRNLSGRLINIIKDVIPNLFGGAADLAPSTKTYMNDAGDYSKENPAGRNIHFGIRELAMAAIGNGIALHGGLRPYVSTFFVFSDYVKPMARLSALMGLPVTYVLTHDSIGVGEDGPTHEPVEQLAMLRSLPNFTVYRPADATETAAAWYHAMNSTDTPTALVLSRQNLPQLAGSGRDALKGGYIVAEAGKEIPDAIVMATGSEVQLGVEAKELLAKEGIDIRVVSMPSVDVFEQQSEDYKERILPKSVRARVAVEALSDFGWGRYIGLDGAMVSMKGFGASGPGGQLFEHFGITTQAVVDAVKETLK